MVGNCLVFFEFVVWGVELYVWMYVCLGVVEFGWMLVGVFGLLGGVVGLCWWVLCKVGGLLGFDVWIVLWVGGESLV